ncbi:MAG: 16S rRNA pseudouridine(516) synthase RsuA [Thiohalomonadaceae bacterium]
MRLDRFLANAAGLTRTQAQRAVRGGEVAVDGAVVRDPSVHVRPEQAVTLRGEAVVVQGSRYFMLHKPTGYVSVTEDGLHPTVLDLIHEPRKKGLHAAGRLDLDATGLVLITDDGDWSHRVTSPRRKCPKRYRVTLAEPLTAAMVEQLSAGVPLRGDDRPTRPAQVEVLAENQVWLTIAEGRYHQVKRMFAAVGNHVLALHRDRIGTVELDPALAPGEYRPLTAQEIAALEACG